ncbi:tRNA (adenosine(37)-N6)-threonylcarbamoyltransferase complex dimerization subunit type 1 TsaB [Roseobacter sp. YSTF-M11]|uniref:tRNA (Adenosine(37)-N6)-threonylcarbamoyltransferase complex dimerization subunit type 1 TsaB n=1 Tax=Roseobacter insulae TaxID=2859783 RepID=A0A9X1K3K2_9RHOB|nr:tRNA (adenosine(37)-N6)-threonylcarbamoyltransferase complex dimerization subunit type 1 TsaB [Roseobacter insulae]MBW4709648.1 tRNA (adenosine(37)-N6)-threonylcarbamoyltransferase complex dimerization subunit type 1 TsaB [Roseobacter insulae]
MTGSHDKRPVILAFDTSAACCSAAVLQGDRIIAQAEEQMSKGQAERLMDLCKELLNASALHFRDLAAIGVGVGPGNFTGIRISVAAARGLALGLGVPAVGVTGFEALRHGFSGACACAIPARRGQVYLQVFDGITTQSPVLVPGDALPAFEGPLIGASGQEAAHPVAVSIAHLAARRFRDAPARPAPLYLRPADAAPARDAPPAILP